MDCVHTPKFTVISAVYQVESYLQEAIDSLLNQTLGFRDNVQLILVDDGSTDGSAAICQACRAQYPSQVMVIRQPNGGQASARNNGLKYATGKYINFMDPDDKLAPDALEKVWDFFERHEQETDMVSIPMHFFEGRTGEHWQNTKFAAGSRIIDLTQEHRVQQSSASSVFFHSRVKHLLDFDQTLYCSEDFKVDLRVLAEKQTLGVVADTKYLYRRRRGDNQSTIQLSTKKKTWYTMWFSGLCGWACEYYTRRFGYLPGYVQYAVLCDLSFRVASDYEEDFHQTLTMDEQEAYRQAIGEALRNFDDRYLQQIPGLKAELMAGLLRLKYGCLPEMEQCGGDVRLHYGDCEIARLSRQAVKYEFITIHQGKIRVEGSVSLCGFAGDVPLAMHMALGNGSVVPCAVERRAGEDLKRLDMTLCACWRFTCDVPLGKAGAQMQPRLILEGCAAECTRVEMGPFVPMSERMDGDCFRERGWIIARVGAGLKVRRGTVLGYRTREELRKWVRLMKLGARKAVIYRMLACALRLFKRRPIWLVSDRVNAAGDNGEALYLCLREHYGKQVDAYFFLSPDCADYRRLSGDKHVLPMFSMKHRLLHMLGDCVLSSAGYSLFNHPFDPIMEGYIKDLSVKPFVFLQHGIIKDDLSDYLAREKQGMMGFVTSSPEEWRSIAHNPAYGYTQEQVWLTGMPRYDRLENREEQVLLIMPTWRRSLFDRYDGVQRRWLENPGFAGTEFVQFYRALMNHPRLLETAQRLGYRIMFAPHPNLRGHLDVFQAPQQVQVVDENITYRELFARGSLLLTDYSSVFFDFAYLKKPMVFAQFDQESFYEGQIYDKGYFDYVRDGFGPVCTDLSTAVEALICRMEQGCVMEEKYVQRVEKFFAYTDRNNARRAAEHALAATRERQTKG